MTSRKATSTAETLLTTPSKYELISSSSPGSASPGGGSWNTLDHIAPCCSIVVHTFAIASSDTTPQNIATMLRITLRTPASIWHRRFTPQESASAGCRTVAAEALSLHVAAAAAVDAWLGARQHSARVKHSRVRFCMHAIDSGSLRMLVGSSTHSAHTHTCRQPPRAHLLREDSLRGRAGVHPVESAARSRCQPAACPCSCMTPPPAAPTGPTARAPATRQDYETPRGHQHSRHRRRRGVRRITDGVGSEYSTAQQQRSEADRTGRLEPTLATGFTIRLHLECRMYFRATHSASTEPRWCVECPAAVYRQHMRRPAGSLTAASSQAARGAVAAVGRAAEPLYDAGLQGCGSTALV